MIQSATNPTILFVFLLGLVTLCACKETEPAPSLEQADHESRKHTELTEQEAIQLAEQFVKDNGYTDVVPANESKLSFELMDQTGEDVSAILERRHNTLHPKAFCISETNNKVWHIGFLAHAVDISNPGTLNLNNDLPGRAVIVDRKSHKVRMAHKDPLFSMFRKL